MDENNVKNAINGTNGKSFKKKLLLGIAGTLLLALLIGLIAFLSGNNSRKLITQLDLGNKYLEAYEYEEAIACFTKAIAIDPMSVEAYLGLVEAYIELNDYDTAYDWAEKGYELTNAPELKEKMDMIDSGSIFDAKGRIHLAKGFDENGNIAGMARYTYYRDKTDMVERLTANGDVAFTVKYEYDDAGRAIVDFSRHSGLYSEFATSYKTYNQDGLVESCKSVWESGRETVNTYEYDAHGRIIVSSETADTNYTSITKYFYPDDEKEYYTRWENYDSEGNLIWSSDFIYDENDVYTEQICYDSQGNVTNRIVHSYDENGNFIGTTDYDSFGNITGSTKVE